MEPKKKQKLGAENKALLCGQTAMDKKAEDVRVLDVRAISSFSDYFVICSGHSTRHVQGIVRAIEETIDRNKEHPRGIEGLQEGQWVLMDYGDVVVHVFYSPARDFYDLEGLWSDAKTMDIEESE